MPSLKDQAIHGTLWSAIEKFALLGIQFLLQIILARLLTPEDYGIVGILAVFLAVANAFIDCGFTSALIQNQQRTEDDFATAFYFNIIVALFFYGILFILAPGIANFYKMPILTSITRVLALTLPISALGAVSRTKLQIAVDFKTQAKATLSAVTISGLIGICLAYNGWGVWALVTQTLLNALLNSILLFCLVRWLPLFRFSFVSFQKMFGFGSKLLAARLLDVLYFNMYPLVIGKIFSATDLGLYSRASSFAHLPSNLTTNIVTRVTFPVFSQIQNDLAHLFTAYKKYLAVISGIYAPVVLGICAIAKPLILVLIGEKWLPATSLLQILCIACLFDCITQINLNLLYVKGYTGAVLKLNVIKRIISFGILLFSLPFGLFGLCIGQVIYSQIALFLNTYYTKKILNFGYWEQLKDVCPIYTVAFGSCLLAFVITWLPISAWLQLTIAIPVTGCVYIGLTCLFQFDIWKEGIRLGKKIKFTNRLLGILPRFYKP